MLTINIVSIHPQFIASYLSFGVLNAAQKKGLIKVNNINLRDFAIDGRGTVDDRPYGGGDGMVLRAEPLAAAVKSLAPSTVILSSPAGKLWEQKKAHFFAKESDDNLSFICGRFSGVDQRFIDQHVDYEFSLGDFILSGGELASLAMVDSIVRTLPQALGHPESAKKDSFEQAFKGGLEHPVYTRPETFSKLTVPSVLLSGNHQKIIAWQRQQSLKQTREKRPDLQQES